MEEKFIVKYGSRSYGTGEFQEIGSQEDLDKWLKDNVSLNDGDEIYRIQLVGVIKEKTELIIKIEE